MGAMTTGREDLLIRRLVEVAGADERIQAVLLYGSRATGTADEHSDVDIGIVPADAEYDAVVADGPRLIAALGEPLFLEWFEAPSWLHAILADGTELELIIERAGDLALARPHRFLLDRTGIGERQRAVASTEEEQAPDPERVRGLVVWFWHDVGHLVTALARGRTWWAFGQLEQLRAVVVRLTRLRTGAPLEDDEPYWKLDQAVPAEELAWLRETIVPPQPEAMRRAALLVLAQYRASATALASVHGFEYPARLDALISSSLEGLSLPPD